MWGVRMIVYHGSSIAVNKPDVFHSIDSVDFGKGFYVTPFKDQAYKWAARYKTRKGTGRVSAYKFDIDIVKEKYHVLEFDGYTEEWLD